MPNRRRPGHGGPPLSRPAMSQQRNRILSIGEVMIEMTRGPDGRFRQTCAGDTFNTAVYLARRGLPVAFASALGDDPYSDQILIARSVGGHLDRSGRARTGPPPRPLPGRDQSHGRARSAFLARRFAGLPVVRIAELGTHRRSHDRRAHRFISPASRCRSIPIPGSAVSSRCSKPRARPAPRWCSTAITARVPGMATSSAPAGFSWRR